VQSAFKPSRTLKDPHLSALFKGHSIFMPFMVTVLAARILLLQLQEQGTGDIFRILTWETLSFSINLSENYCNYGHDRAVRVKGKHILSNITTTGFLFEGRSVEAARKAKSKRRKIVLFLIESFWHKQLS
jgi:hypothetical protein